VGVYDYQCTHALTTAMCFVATPGGIYQVGKPHDASYSDPLVVYGNKSECAPAVPSSIGSGVSRSFV
jgi:hypothetical protein